MRRNFLIGSDPEFFIETAGGTFINVYEGLYNGNIKGTKAQPEKTAYGAIQVDGMALEINTIPTNIPTLFSEMVRRGMVDGANRWKAANLSLASIKEFDQDWLLSQDPGAIELGCDPDFNAWRDGEVNPRPDMEKPIRTAGGHIHVGWIPEGQIITDVTAHTDECCKVVKHLDYALGAWSLVEDKNGSLRRSMYGAPGAFRPKNYGVEYRVLSNFWIFRQPYRVGVFKRTMAAMNAYDDGLKFYEVFGDMILEAFSVGKNTSVIIKEVNKLLDPYLKELDNAAA